MATDGRRHTLRQGAGHGAEGVREALGLRQGEQLSWELEDGSVRVRAVAPFDLAYLQGLDSSLSEWSSPADEEAFRDL